MKEYIESIWYAPKEDVANALNMVAATYFVALVIILILVGIIFYKTFKRL